MTNNDTTSYTLLPREAPRPDATRAQILSRYADLKFAPLTPNPYPELNRRRGARRKTSRATRTIL